MNLLVEVAECSVGMLRTGFGLVNIDDMCLRPFRARNFSRWLSVGYRFFLRKFPKIPLLGGTFTQATFHPNLKHDEILNLLSENLCFWFLARMLVCSALWCCLLPCAKVPAPGRRLDVVPDVVPRAAQPVLKARHQSLLLALQSWIP